MIAKNIVSRVTLALAVAAVVLPMPETALAGGYGYGSHSGWNGYQAHTPKRQKARGHAYAGSNRHLAWCYDRYRSYRLSDNSFQPYHGPRRECLSPYEQERRALFVGYPGEAPEILFRDQAGTDADRNGRDTFGNLPEGGLVGSAVTDGGGGSDEFGNLPEQAALSHEAAPAVENRAEADNVQGTTAEDALTAAPEAGEAPAAAVGGEADLVDVPEVEASAPVKAEVPQPVAPAVAKAPPEEEADDQSPAD